MTVVKIILARVGCEDGIGLSILKNSFMLKAIAYKKPADIISRPVAKIISLPFQNNKINKTIVKQKGGKESKDRSITFFEPVFKPKKHDFL